MAVADWTTRYGSRGPYPTLGGRRTRLAGTYSPKTQTNYQAGGSGIAPEGQYRPDGYTKPVQPDHARGIGGLAPNPELLRNLRPTDMGGMVPAPKPPPPGVPTQAPSPAARPPGGDDRLGRLGQAEYGRPQTQGGQPVAMQDLGKAIEQLMGSPSRFQQEAVVNTYNQLLDTLQQRVSEDAARRGLEFSSVPQDIFGREAGRIAGQLATEQARTYADDLRQALGMGMGFGQQAFQNQLATRGLNLQELAALQGLGGYAQQPLGLAAQTGMDYAGALGQQAAGLGGVAGDLAAILPFLMGGGGGGGYGIYPGATPDFNPYAFGR